MPEPQTVSTEILRTLHRIHRQLSDLKERLDRCPKRMRAAEANVAHRESLLVEAKKEEKTFRIALDQRQLQLKTSEAKVKELRIKLNTAQSNREYQTLLEQILAAEMANSVLADEILEALDKVDEHKKKVARSESDMAAARQKLEKVRVEVSEQEPLLRGDIKRLEAELKQSEAALPAEVREPYQRVVHHLGEDALAPVENQCCGGCNQQIPLNLCSRIMMNQPVFCKSCGRMLYMTEANMTKHREE
jgi:predicted  nucleic acid-binding Zn-ribbon protein